MDMTISGECLIRHQAIVVLGEFVFQGGDGSLAHDSKLRFSYR